MEGTVLGSAVCISCGFHMDSNCGQEQERFGRGDLMWYTKGYGWGCSVMLVCRPYIGSYTVPHLPSTAWVSQFSSSTSWENIFCFSSLLFGISSWAGDSDIQCYRCWENEMKT